MNLNQKLPYNRIWFPTEVCKTPQALKYLSTVTSVRRSPNLLQELVVPWCFGLPPPFPIHHKGDGCRHRSKNTQSKEGESPPIARCIDKGLNRVGDGKIYHGRTHGQDNNKLSRNLDILALESIKKTAKINLLLGSFP